MQVCMDAVEPHNGLVGHHRNYALRSLLLLLLVAYGQTKSKQFLVTTSNLQATYYYSCYSYNNYSYYSVVSYLLLPNAISKHFPPVLMA